MKHARADYDRIQDPSGKIPKDEPVFLLRAQDQFAAETVRYYAQLIRDHNGDEKIAVACFAQARAMELWPKKKMPDLPVPKVKEDPRPEETEGSVEQPPKKGRRKSE